MRYLALLGLLAVSLPAFAVPETFTHLGFLEDENGDPLDGSVTLTFSLYDDADATNPALWSESVDTDVYSGVYTVVLGHTAPLGKAILDQHPMFLGLSVDGGTEMVPRQELASVPYTVLSETAYDLRGGTVNATSVQADSLTVDEVSVDSLSATNIEADSFTATTLTVGTTTLDEDGLTINGKAILDASGSYVGTPPLPPDLGCGEDDLVVWDSQLMVWMCGSEVDPVFSSSPVGSVTEADVAGWDLAVEAYEWGDHAKQGYLKSERDPVFRASTAFGIQDTDVGRWNQVFGFVDAAEFVFTDPDDPIEEPISAQDVEQWEHAWAVTNGSEPGDWQNWDEAFRFSIGFAEYVDGEAPAQGITQADLNGWRASADLVSTIVDLTDPPPANSINAASVQQWNRNAFAAYNEPLTTCLQVLQAFPETPDGFYWLIYPYDGSMQKVYCDMVAGVNHLGQADTSPGGGWTRISYFDFTNSINGAPDGVWTGGAQETMVDDGISGGCGSGGELDGVPDHVYGGVSTFGKVQYGEADRAVLKVQLEGRSHTALGVKWVVIPVGDWVSASQDPFAANTENPLFALDPNRTPPCNPYVCKEPLYWGQAYDTSKGWHPNVECGGSYPKTLGRQQYGRLSWGHTYEDATELHFYSDLNYRVYDPQNNMNVHPGYWKLDDVEVWIK